MVDALLDPSNVGHLWLPILLVSGTLYLPQFVDMFSRLAHRSWNLGVVEVVRRSSRSRAMKPSQGLKPGVIVIPAFFNLDDPIAVPGSASPVSWARSRQV